MRFHHKIKNSNKLLFVLTVLLVFIVCSVEAQTKSEGKPTIVTIELKVTDEAGVPVSNAQVVLGESRIFDVTGEDGLVTIDGYSFDIVTITAPGFEKNMSFVKNLESTGTIKLSKSKLYLTKDDFVPFPFMALTKRHITGSSKSIKSRDLETYPSADLRNALTGLANGVIVREIDGSPGISAEEQLNRYGAREKIDITSRGRQMIYIIDEIPTDITEMPLDPGEIESVTVIKDVVGKSMFGPSGADGIIFIKTKRGAVNKRVMRVNLENGISVIDRFPEMVSGADYARLNNIARQNSGLDPLYSEEDIAAYAKNDPYDFFHPSVNFREMMLKNTKAFRRADISSTGGNERVQYFAYLGYNNEDDIYKIGSPADYNRINSRANIDIVANDLVRVQFDFFGGVSFRRSPNYIPGTINLTEFWKVIGNINNIPPIAFPVYANNDPQLVSPWYAVTPSYGQNPIGNLMKNGYYTETGRSGAFNVALDYDLSNIIDGLTSRTYIGYNAYNQVRLGKAEDYDAYIVRPQGDTYSLVKVHDGVDQHDMAKLSDFYYERIAFYENLKYRKTFGLNSFQASMVYFQSKVSRAGIKEPERLQTGVLSALYSYDDKYNLHGVLNYSGSSSFSKEERYILSPTLGVSWIASDEGFLKDVSFVDYLKVRMEGGVTGYEGFNSPFLYRDHWTTNTSGVQFGPAPTSQWFGSSTDNPVYRTNINRLGNPDLTWEKRREFNAGMDLLMFNNKLDLEINYFNQFVDGDLTRVYNTIPYYAGVSSWVPYVNQNQIRYYGVETMLQYTHNLGDFRYTFGGNATMLRSKFERYDQPNYRFEYQSRIGKPVDGIWGHRFMGRFDSDQEALLVPQLYDNVLGKDDFKYEDKNQDGVVDDNDMSMIGNSSPRLYYALNARFTYKNVELYVLGTGYAFYDILLNNNYYWNGWGDDNYSRYVLENQGGENFPKLSYYKVNNNFVSSDFWLTKGGFFKIQNAELAWNIPASEKLKWSGARNLRLFARGANLLTLTKVKDIDPESKNSGVSTYPLYRTFTGGISLIF